MSILKQLEGYNNLFYDVVGPTAVGTGVARVTIDSTYKVPSAARELIGVIPFIMGEAPAPAESILAIGDVGGVDFKGQPQEFLFPVAAGKLGAIDQLETTPAEFWAMHQPLKGTETLDFGQEMCDANAANAQAMLTLVFSTRPSGRRPIFGKFSREISGSTTAAYVANGTNLSINNGIRMYEVVAAAVYAGVVTADEELASKATMKCTNWDPIQSCSFFMAPIHGIEATSGVGTVKSIQRLPFDARFKKPEATVETLLEQYDGLTNAPMYVHGIRWYGSR